MLRNLTNATLLVVLLSGAFVRPCSAWEVSEHRYLGDTVYLRLQWIDSTLLDPDLLRGLVAAQRGDSQDTVAPDWSFGQLCAFYAAIDYAQSRFHDRGKTPLEQLRTVDSAVIAEAISEVIEDGTLARTRSTSRQQFQAPHIQASNAISAYLLHHLVALRIVGRPQGAAGDLRERLRLALVIESIAQGYLADAFSAGHLLVGLDDLFSPLHPRNNREIHNHFCTEGVYVINSRGDVWQTFGDRLLHWYPHSLAAVIEACEYSLKEVLVTYHVLAGDPLPDGLRMWLAAVAPGTRAEELVSAWLSNRDGTEYYDSIRMPTLMLIPMPVAASWSIRTDSTDANGTKRRHHYPQLREDGLHDPDSKGIDREFLFARSSVPDWLVPEPLQADTHLDPFELIRSNPDWASVRWVQNRTVAPSFKGTLLHVGGQLLLDCDSPYMIETFGLGYGLFDDLILLRNISAELSVQGITRKNDSWAVSLSVGGGVTVAGIGFIRTLHFEGGPALVNHAGNSTARGMVAVGIDSAVLPLGFTHAGVTVRVKYATLLGDSSRRGPALELILH